MTAVANAPKPRTAQILGKAVLRAADALGLSHRTLAAVLGISESSVSRLARGRPIDPEGKEGELAVLFLRTYRSLDALLGGDDARSRAWVHAENDHLAGVPAERIRTVTGLCHVAEYLDALRGKS